MKKSIRGNLKAQNQADKDAIVADINKYVLWRLQTDDAVDDTTGATTFTFEAWVNNDTDESSLWTDIKGHCDRLGGHMDRHDCTHDEAEHKPCVIAESYER